MRQLRKNIDYIEDEAMEEPIVLPSPFPSLRSKLLEGDEISPATADDLVLDARERVWNGEDPCEILREAGIELPDYIVHQIVAWC